MPARISSTASRFAGTESQTLLAEPLQALALVLERALAIFEAGDLADHFGIVVGQRAGVGQDEGRVGGADLYEQGADRRGQVCAIDPAAAVRHRQPPEVVDTHDPMDDPWGTADRQVTRNRVEHGELAHLAEDPEVPAPRAGAEQEGAIGDPGLEQLQQALVGLLDRRAVGLGRADQSHASLLTLGDEPSRLLQAFR